MSAALINRFMKRLCNEINSHPEENAMSYFISTFENYIRRRMRTSVCIFFFLIILSLVVQSTTLFYVVKFKRLGGGAALMASTIAA